MTKGRVNLYETTQTPLRRANSVLPQSQRLIESAGSENGRMYVLEGLFLEGEIHNNNGRLYPRKEIERAVDTLAERLKTGGSIPAELDHPEGMNINFDRLAAGITEIHMEGDNGVGQMIVGNGGLGAFALYAIDLGVRVGVSSRGTGNLSEDEIVSDYEIVTIDLVLTPSAPNAFPEPIMAESVGQTRLGREAMELAQLAENDPAARKHLHKSMTEYLGSLGDQVTWRNRYV